MKLSFDRTYGPPVSILKELHGRMLAFFLAMSRPAHSHHFISVPGADMGPISESSRY